jgi:predicted phosphohydrolase
MRIVCLSDTHGQHGKFDVPDGDLLLHAGDATRMGRTEEIISFNAWLGTLPHRHKVVIAGNHDWGFERDPSNRFLLTHATYLIDEGCTIEGLRIWGSPWQPRFFDWAFNLDRGAPLRRIWAKVPTGVDILLSHSPPQGILDRTSRGDTVGCEELREALNRIRPRLHVFGHIHESYGQLKQDETIFVNASVCTLRYAPTQKPIVIDL